MNSTRIAHGIYGGLAGGLVFGVMMGMMGMLPMIAKMAGGSSPAVGFLVHLVISAVIGIGFALLVGGRVGTIGATTASGLAYGLAWWFLGPLTLMPMMMGMGVMWKTGAMSAAMPSLIGHLVYGGILGAVYGWLDRPVAVTRRA